MFKTASGVLTGALEISVVWLGARHVRDGGFSVGQLLAFVTRRFPFLEKL